MNEKPRKWRRRLLWVLPIALGAYALAKLGDGVWYRTQRPASFRDVRWTGEWRINRYGGLTGRLLVKLPDPLPENADFKAEALVYYPVYSVWKTGQFVPMEFTGHFSPDSPVAGGQSTNVIPGGGKLKFKAVVGSQVVDYVALIADGRTTITGGYLSRSPDDFGSFWIEWD